MTSIKRTITKIQNNEIIIDIYKIIFRLMKLQIFVVRQNSNYDNIHRNKSCEKIAYNSTLSRHKYIENAFSLSSKTNYITI